MSGPFANYDNEYLPNRAGDYQRKIDNLEAENKALRDALEKIADPKDNENHSHAITIARAALKAIKGEALE